MSDTPFPIGAAQPQTDSYAPLVKFIEIRIPNQNPGGDGSTSFHQLPAYDILQSFQITHNGQTGVSSAVPWATVNLFFKSEQNDRTFASTGGGGDTLTQADIVDRIMPVVGTQFNLQWNWGRDAGGQDAFTRAPFYQFTVSRVYTQFTPAGLGLRLEGTGEIFISDGSDAFIPSYIVQAYNKNPDYYAGPRSWPDTYTARDIVLNIADFYGWSYFIGSSSVDSTIEDSVPALGGIAMLANESHLDFIIQRLLPLSMNQYGEPFVFYFDRDSVLHFHSRRYYGVFVSRAYRVYRDMKGEVISFEPDDGSLFAAVGGSDGVYESVLADAGLFLRQYGSATTGVDLRGIGRLIEGVELYVTNAAVALAAGVTGGAGLALATPLIGLKGRTADEAVTRAMVHNQALAENRYGATLEVRGTHKVRVFDYVVVEYYTSGVGGDANPIYYLSGLYQVVSLEHRVSGSWTTVMKLVRKGIAPPFPEDISDGRAIPLGVPEEQTIPNGIGGSGTNGIVGIVWLPSAVYDP